jgi:glutamine amidotransferase
MKNNNIIIIDYGIGNIKSIYNAIKINGYNPIISNDTKKILNADRIILPGVGAFRVGMENLQNFGLTETIHDFVKKGNPFLGICLGMQLLLDESEEFGFTKGLGLVKGRVVKLPSINTSKEKLPHISWNEINQTNEQSWNETILDGIKFKSDVYFVHSYVAVPKSAKDVLATTKYSGVEFCSAIKNENIFGTQFHPEKSGNIGLKILNNFLNL